VNVLDEPLPARRRWAHAATALVALGIVGVVLHRLQFSSHGLIDNDGYFHIKFSYLMTHGEALIRKLPWLHFTIHRDYYRDHHFLQHVLLAPFTFFDLRLGAKYAAWAFATLAFGAFYLAAARRGVLVAGILTVALLGGGNHFLYRMMMTRVPSLSLALLLVVVWLLAERRDRWLAVAMFAYVWLYDGFVQGLVAILLMVLAELFVEGRFNGRTLAWGLAGVLAGMVINPYFPHNFESYLFNLHRTVGEAQLSISDTGWEWKPLESYYLLRNFRATWTAFGIGLLLAALGRRTSRETVGTLLLAVLMTALIMKARRYSDVWPGVVFLFLAFAWADFWDDFKQRFGERTRGPRWVATAALAGLLAFFIPRSYHKGVEMVESESSFEHYKGASEYLLANAEPKTVVFNAGWDDFPFLFFFNSENYYVLGLDQLYMRRYDEKLYDKWREIRSGEVTRPSRQIRSLFGAEWAVINLQDERQEKFFRRARRDAGMALEYRDDYCAVYRILPPAAPRGAEQASIGG
jgi:hypothetical protein